MFDCSNGLRSNTHFVVIMAEIEHVMEEVARYECVYHRNSKDFKNKHKKANCWNKIDQKFNLSAGEAEAKFRNIRTAYGRYLKRLKTLPSGSGRDAVPREFKNLQWLNPHINKFACSKTSSSTSAMLFALQPTRACIFGTSADQNVWLGRLCDRCDYMETAFFAIVCDCLRSAICDLRSSAIVCDHMETIHNSEEFNKHFRLILVKGNSRPFLSLAHDLKGVLQTASQQVENSTSC